MSNVKRILRSVESTVTDLQTGEALTSTVKTLSQHSKEPEYVKLYLKDIGALHYLTAGALKVFVELGRLGNYQGEVILSERRKKAIQETVDLKNIKNHITELVQKGLLKKLGNNDYLLNPELFGRGHWDAVCQRRENFEVKLSYSKDGRKVETTNI